MYPQIKLLTRLFVLLLGVFGFSYLQGAPVGNVVSWGLDSSGQLGDNILVQRTVPVAVQASGVLAGKTIVSLSSGGGHTLALASDGTIYAWGSNSSGQLGNATTADSVIPVVVNAASGTSALYGKTVVAVAAGASFSLALASDGTVYGWGQNGNGQLGTNTTVTSLVPVAVNMVSGVSAFGWENRDGDLRR